MNITENYSVNLIIVDHFDAIIRIIDIKTEKLLCAGYIYDELFDELNIERKILVEKVKEIEKFNLNANSQEIFEQKWKDTIENKNIDDKIKMELFKKDCIKSDCLLRPNNSFKLGITMWITSWHIRPQDESFLKNFDSKRQFQDYYYNGAKYFQIECMDKEMIRNFCLLSENDVDPAEMIHDLRSLNPRAMKSLDIDYSQYGFKKIGNEKDNGVILQVNEILNDTFSEFTRLEKLKMSFSRILHMDTIISQITDLANLKHIDLSSNSLKYLSTELFFGLKHLITIDLSHNELSSLDARVFCGLDNLKMIKLDFNYFDKFESGMLMYVKNLQKLYLKNNQIRSINSDNFKTLACNTKLEILSLDRNCLTSLEGNAFMGLTKLKNLSLKSNELKKLDDAVFVGLDNLRILDLSCNVLKNVASSIFDPLNNLECLNFFESGLKASDIAAFTNLNNLKVLNLYEKNFNELVQPFTSE